MKFILIINIFFFVACELTPVGSDSTFVVESLLGPAVNDIQLSGNTTLVDTPTVSWTAPADGASVDPKVYTYEVGLGTSPKQDNIVAFTNIGGGLSHQFTGLTSNLSSASNYYLLIRAIDQNGRPSVIGSSSAFFPALINVSGGLQLPEANPYLSDCNTYLNSSYYRNDGTGRYWIDPDGVGGNAAFLAECDMDEDSGGWTLVLNYLHQSGDNSSLDIRSTNLPLINSSNLGDNEASDPLYWGHAGVALFNSITKTEVRFYCITSTHSRVLDFKTSHNGTLNYLNSGVGSASGIWSNFTSLQAHNANLPGVANSAQGNHGDEAPTRFTFFLSGTYHWGVRANGNRWECDDTTPGDFAQNTLHRVWVR